MAGRYELMALLGRGGMGEVWRARDLRSDRRVAVKLLLTEAGGEEAVARFRREATIGSRVRHPGVVAVHDAGQDAGRLYIVMELLEGSDLSAVLAGRPAGLPLPEVLDLAVRIAEVLAAAHEEGIVHRDLKPANLFRQTDGTVKICDFGIARTRESTVGLTVTGRPFGTPAYMAPEQWRGVHVDTRCDLYALGCVLYALLTGSPPYSGDYYVLMRRHAEDTAPSLQTLRPEVSFELDRLVAALLQKDPARRPDSARAVAAVLCRVRDLPGGVAPMVETPGGHHVEGPLVAWLLARVRTSTDLMRLSQAAVHAHVVSPALALELVELAETRLWELEPAAEFMLALDWLCTTWTPMAPRRVASLIAAAEERFGHIEWVAGKMPGLLVAIDPHRAAAAARRLPPGIDRDRAWTSLARSTRDPRISLLWLANITDPVEREKARIEVALNASDTDMAEAMRILSGLTRRWSAIVALADLGYRRATRYSDPVGARPFVERARREASSYAPESDPPEESGSVRIRLALSEADQWITIRERQGPRGARPSATGGGTPLDGTTARARGSAIPDTPDGAHQLVDLAVECLGGHRAGRFGNELLNLVSPRAPIPPQDTDTITS
ncbi:serine/threonine-protein kinase (plasmid) [Streptomyces sp. BI20]|uniref:serine/threonine-protein kinase n=1 Tax=Streptomyces sp. BI20 TaxID=3403460 RepID=UPI003C740962